MRLDSVKKTLVSTVLLLALATACAGGENEGGAGGADGKGSITVGVSSAFAENQIVAEMYAQVLEKAGYDVERRLNLKTREISEPALERGEIDVVPEYLGSLLVFLDKDAAAAPDAQKAAEEIRKLLENRNAALLDPSQANNTNTFVVTEDKAEELGLTRISDLAPVAGRLRLGGPPECPNRPFCIPGLKEKYGITFREFRPLDVGGPLTVSALEGGEIDVALLFTTSPIIQKKGFRSLEDDKGLQQAENITPLVNREVVNDEIRRLLNEVSKKLSTENISELNGKVEIDKEDPEDVAKDFLEQEALV